MNILIGFALILAFFVCVALMVAAMENQTERQIARTYGEEWKPVGAQRINVWHAGAAMLTLGTVAALLVIA